MNIKIRVRPCVQTYLVFSCMFGIPLLICAIETIIKNSMWECLVVCLLCLIFVFVWLHSYRVTIDSDIFEYKNLLHTRRIIRLSDVKFAKVEVGYARYRDRFKPPIRLVVNYVEGGREKFLYVNLKLFSKSDVEQILLALNAT